MAAKHSNNTCTLCMYIYIVGHEVVRLPVAHCKLNPIEMAWSQVKGYVKDKARRLLCMHTYICAAMLQLIIR